MVKKKSLSNAIHLTNNLSVGEFRGVFSIRDSSFNCGNKSQ